MFTKALLEYEQHFRWWWNCPGDPCWRPAIPCSFSSVAGSACGTADCPGMAVAFQTAKPALHLGHSLLGAYENGGFDVLQEVIDFAMERGFLAAIDDDFERGLDECAPHVADKIVECTAPRGLVIFVIGSIVCLFCQVADAGDFPLAPMIFAFLRAIELRVMRAPVFILNPGTFTDFWTRWVVGPQFWSSTVIIPESCSWGLFQVRKFRCWPPASCGSTSLRGCDWCGQGGTSTRWCGVCHIGHYQVYPDAHDVLQKYLCPAESFCLPWSPRGLG